MILVCDETQRIQKHLDGALVQLKLNPKASIRLPSHLRSTAMLASFQLCPRCLTTSNWTLTIVRLVSLTRVARRVLWRMC
jgi:hypothetical protein